MTEDNRTLWVGNLHDKVTEELLYELFLQTGPIERLILPTEGETEEEKKHKGQAYVVFQHPESVQYASQVLEGSSLFAHPLAIKARALPVTYKKPANGRGRGQYDSSSLRGGMNKSTTWHGGNDFTPKGRGSYRGRGGTTNYTPTTAYSYGAYGTAATQMAPTAYWMTGQVTTDPTQVAGYTAATTTLDTKKQTTQNMMYGMTQSVAQQQGMWASNSYGTMAAGGWVMANTADPSTYQGYTDQYGNWYQQQ